MRASEVEEMRVVAICSSRRQKCRASLARSTPSSLHSAAACLQRALVAGVAGCQLGGSRSMSNPIEIGEALMSAMLRAVQKATKPDETNEVSLSAK